MSFSNPITGGQGALIRPAIKSPNFLTGVSGWTINRDGSAEFNNGIFRGTVTASTFQGTDFVINSAGFFLYSGTPALGNLVYAVAATPGTDSFGNAYFGGLNVGNQQGAHFGLDTNGNVYVTNASNILTDFIRASDGTITVGASGQSQLVLNPNAANPFNSGTIQAAEQYFTTDVNQMMPSMAGSLLFNAGAANQQMATVLHCPIGATNGYAMVLSADSDDSTIGANLAVGTVTTDGTSMNFDPRLTVDVNGDTVANSYAVYNASSNQVVVTYSTAGAHTFITPTGVTSVKAEAWGGGGGGQGGSGAGGGGGEYAAEAVLVVVPGTHYTATVGAGGAGGPGGVGGVGSAGGNSTMVGASVTVTGHGGAGSTSGTTAATSGSSNTTHHNGGGGTTASTGVSTGGGGGGASGGSAAAGTTGHSNSGVTGGAGGAAVTNGGAGGAGGAGTGTGGTAGVAGGFPGGGGGTGGAGSSSNSAGGAGSVGQVRITYTPPATTAIVGSLTGVAFTDSLGNTVPQGLMTTKAVAVHPGSSPQVPETWQTPSYATNFASGGFSGELALRYRIDIEDNLYLVGGFHTTAVAGIGAGSTSTIFTLPAAYRPAAGIRFPAYQSTGTAGTTCNMVVQSGGNVIMLNTTALANAQVVEFSVKVPLGNLT